MNSSSSLPSAVLEANVDAGVDLREILWDDGWTVLPLESDLRSWWGSEVVVGVRHLTPATSCVPPAGQNLGLVVHPPDWLGVQLV